MQVMTLVPENKITETDRISALTDSPDLTGDTITFLTQERREWLAGRFLSCNWDMEEFLARKDEIVQGDKLKVRLVL